MGAKFGGVFKYLTFLNMVLQCLFFCVCFFANYTRQLVKTRDVMFASAAFPIGMFVGLVFWALYAVDRELIFSARFDKYFPWWMNHLMHTTVLPLQLLELVTTHHVYPSRSKGGLITAAITLAYLIWINVVFYMGGFWVYPVFKVLSEGQRVVFMIFLAGMSGLLYLGGEKANTLIWGKTEPRGVKKE